MNPALYFFLMRRVQALFLELSLPSLPSRAGIRQNLC